MIGSAFTAAADVITCIGVLKLISLSPNETVWDYYPRGLEGGMREGEVRGEEVLRSVHPQRHLTKIRLKESCVHAAPCMFAVIDTSSCSEGRVVFTSQPQHINIRYESCWNQFMLNSLFLVQPGQPEHEQEFRQTMEITWLDNDKNTK